MNEWINNNFYFYLFIHSFKNSEFKLLAILVLLCLQVKESELKGVVAAMST